MRPGDHAFLGYDGEGEGWGVLSAFVWSGLAHGEKVMVLGPVGVSPASMRARLQQAPGLLIAAGHASGQLVLATLAERLAADAADAGGPSPHPLQRAKRAWIDEARAAGFPGLRSYVDMGDAAGHDSAFGDMLDQELAASALFQDGYYSEICAYDRTGFPRETLDAVCRAHPHNLLPRLGQLTWLRHGDTLRLVGEADLATRDVLAKALAHRGEAERATIDLTGLTFLGAECADDLVDVLGTGHGGAGARVRCAARDAALLVRLGADPADIEVCAR